MWSPTFMLYAFSSLFIARVACSDLCPDDDEGASDALKNSIDEYIEDLRRDNKTSGGLDRVYIKMDGKYHSKTNGSNVTLHLGNATVTGFSNFNVTKVVVERFELRPKIKVSLSVTIPSIVLKTKYRLHGIWRNKPYRITGQLKATTTNKTATIKLNMKLAKKFGNWKLTTLTIPKNSVKSESIIVTFKNNVAGNYRIKDDKDLEEWILGKIDETMREHFSSKILRRSRNLSLDRCSYAIIIGEFGKDAQKSEPAINQLVQITNAQFIESTNMSRIFKTPNVQ